MMKLVSKAELLFNNFCPKDRKNRCIFFISNYDFLETHNFLLLGVDNTNMLEKVVDKVDFFDDDVPNWTNLYMFGDGFVTMGQGKWIRWAGEWLAGWVVRWLDGWAERVANSFDSFRLPFRCVVNWQTFCLFLLGSL